jgi:RND family efflux transporter MFP subunit
VETAAARPMRETLSAYGVADYAPQSQTTVAATAEVLVDQILVAAGQTVEAGQPLLRLRNSANSLLELQKARVDAGTATRDLARTQRLYGEHLATNADLDAARQNAASARAAAASADSRMSGEGGRVVVAQHAGTVVSLDVARGDMVAAGAALLHLSSDNRMDVRLGIEPADVGKVRAGQKVVLHPVYDSSLSIEGVVGDVIGRIDPASGLAQTLVRLADTHGLLPGSGVRGEIEVMRRDAVLSVPRSAVLSEGEQSQVFVVDGKQARQVEVETGADDGARVEIVSGLKAGAVVVTEGNHELEDGMAVAIDGKSIDGKAIDEEKAAAP